MSIIALAADCALSSSLAVISAFACPGITLFGTTDRAGGGNYAAALLISTQLKVANRIGIFLGDRYHAGFKRSIRNSVSLIWLEEPNDVFFRKNVIVQTEYAVRGYRDTATHRIPIWNNGRITKFNPRSTTVTELNVMYLVEIFDQKLRLISLKQWISMRCVSFNTLINEVSQIRRRRVMHIISTAGEDCYAHQA